MAKNYKFYSRDQNLIGIKRPELMDRHKMARLFSDVDKLLVDAPLGGRNLRLIVDSIKDPHTLGITTIGSPNIQLNWRLLMPDAKTPGYFQPKNFMPSAATADPIQYTLAHEWGHALEPTHRQHQAGEDIIVQMFNQATAADAAAAEAEPPVAPEMSEYAASDPEGHEAFAEFFAEWYITPKHDWRGILRTFAEEFGWEKAMGE
jgi:hypothetical protein